VLLLLVVVVMMLTVMMAGGVVMVRMMTMMAGVVVVAAVGEWGGCSSTGSKTLPKTDTQAPTHNILVEHTTMFAASIKELLFVMQ